MNALDVELAILDKICILDAERHLGSAETVTDEKNDVTGSGRGLLRCRAAGDQQHDTE